MFVNFFIKRPIFAIVCSIIIVFLGAIVLPTLPVAQFPEISPVQVLITSNYLGADAETVETGVTNILEQEINGVEGVRYISSTSGSDGTSQITVTFDSSQDPDIAAVNVQNRVSRVESQLPDLVNQTGVVVNQQNSNFLMAVALYPENNEYDPLFLSNYADIYMVDALKRLKGVGDVQIFGERKYAMRLWLDPNRLASRGLTTQDVADAIREQNIQVGAGAIGQQPAADNQEYQLNLRAESRLTSAKEFEELVLKTGANGNLVKVKDVGRVELGAENYGSFLTFDGKEAVGLGILQRPGTNALQTADEIRATLADLKKAFPPGMNYAIAFDTTTFVSISLHEVVITLLTAIALVVFILFIFLQDWRTTLIPAITIPVSLIGTFIFTKIFGFSLNTLTLFGLTLVTGVVVDDAIVVTEAIASKVQDQGIPPVRAAVEAMQELTGAVIATSLALMAVFIPVAFFPGTTGAIYRQFALTIAFSIVISTFNALTLSPSLSALLLRQRPEQRGILSRIFGVFNRFLDRVRRQYRGALQFFVRIRYIVLALFIASLGLTAWMYQAVPSAFLPEEDQGYFITVVQAPEGVSLNYTRDVLKRADEIVRQSPEVADNFSIAGFSFAGSAPNQGIMFTNLKPWEERRGKNQSVQGIIQQVQPQFFGIPEARVFAFVPPSIQGLGNFGGFQMEVQDRRGNLSLEQFVTNAFNFIGEANKNPNMQGVLTLYSANTPQLLVEVNRDRAKALNVDINTIFNTLQSFLGSQYVNDFTLDQRNYRVYLQADQQFRSNPEDIRQFYVRSQDDRMIPLGNLVTITPTTSAQTITHYNLFRSISVQGAAAPGKSSGQALNAMEATAERVLPAGMGYEWTGTALEERESGGQAPLIFGLGLVLVFLVLAAQYESFIDPAVILFSVPLAVLGALAAVFLRGIANDVYCQIGLVMLIGLASKNAILIVEYANQLRDDGWSTIQAAIEASQERLRPILMTAISSIVGFFPLAIAVGAGAESRQSLGTALVGGFFVASVLSLFVVPVLYIIAKNVNDRLFPPNKDRQTQIKELAESNVL